MAIKGKSRSRGAKAVTQGPKPAYVPVKVPWHRRRWLWAVVATLVVVGSIEGIVYGVVRERDTSRRQDLTSSMAVAVNTYRGDLDPILSQIGSVVPPSSFSAFPDLASAVSGLQADPVTNDALNTAAKTADAAATTAKDLGKKIDDVDVNGIVQDKGFSRSFVLYLLNSKTGFVRALDLYRQTALLAAMAAGTDAGSARDDLVARAAEVHDLADQVFASAYSDYVEAQISANVFTPSGPGSIQPVTGPTGPSA